MFLFLLIQPCVFSLFLFKQEQTLVLSPWDLCSLALAWLMELVLAFFRGVLIYKSEEVLCKIYVWVI